MSRRRIRGRGSVEPLGPGRWRARIRGHAPDGRPFDLQQVRAERDEAERALEGMRRRANDIEAGLVVIEETLTLGEWKPRAVRHKLPWSRSDASTWKYLRPLWNVPMVALDASRVREWAEGMREKFKPATVRTAWILLRRMVGKACDARVLARLPWGDERLALVSESECGAREGLAPHQWDAVCDAGRQLDRIGKGGALSDLWLRLVLMRVAVSRPVELCQVGPSDLVAMPAGAALFISDHIVAKGGKPGKKPLGAELAAALSAHWEAMPAKARALALFFPQKGQRGRWSSRLRIAPDGKKAGKFYVTASELRNLRTLSGVATFVPYELRHTGLTEAAHKYGPQAAQQLGGHRVARTTQRYVHSQDRHLSDEMFDTGSVIHAGAGAVGSSDDEPPPDGTSGPKVRGRFAVHEGGSKKKSAPASSAPASSSPPAKASSSEPTVAVASQEFHAAFHAHERTENHGRQVGADADELATAGDWITAVRAHGCGFVAEHVIAAEGPAHALWLGTQLAWISLSPECQREGWSEDLRALVHALRAHGSGYAVMADPNKGRRTSALLNDPGAVEGL
jgi:integrase